MFSLCLSYEKNKKENSRYQDDGRTGAYVKVIREKQSTNTKK
jgi:hypothetical protein